MLLPYPRVRRSSFHRHLSFFKLAALTLAVLSVSWTRVQWIANTATCRVSSLAINSISARPLKICREATAKDRETSAEEGEQKRGYQFGDFFINKLTGKDKYEFGDLSRMIDGKIKDAACQLTGKEKYEFGDISKFFDASAKAEVCKLTGKDTYEFGDISKEIARRVQAGEVDYDDMSLLLRAVLTLGLGLTPVAHLLPVQYLLGLYTQSLQYEASTRAAGKISGAVATELDRRAKGAILGQGNEDYVLGDFTKANLQKRITEITGKDSYEFGDITKALAQQVQTRK